MSTQKTGFVSKVKRWDKLTKHEISEKYTFPVECALPVLDRFLQSNVQSNDNVDAAIGILINILDKASAKIPTTKYRGNVKPYWNKQLKLLKEIKVAKFRISNNDGRPRCENSRSWREHKEARKTFNKELNRLAKEYDDRHVLQAIKAGDTDRNLFWRLVNKCRKKSSRGINNIRNSTGNVVFDLKDVLEAFKGHFVKVCTPVS